MNKDEKYRKRNFLYNCYRNMMNRCYKLKDKQYTQYGGRGIKVEPFLQNWINYVDYAHSLLPKGKTIGDMRRLRMSLDRYPDENGDYKRGNLRWATQKEQKLNRNLFKNNRSGYLGVYKNWNKWLAQIRVNGKRIHVGVSDLPEECFHLFQKAYLKHHGPEAHAKMMDRQRKRCEELGLKLKEYT